MVNLGWVHRRVLECQSKQVQTLWVGMNGVPRIRDRICPGIWQWVCYRPLLACTKVQSIICCPFGAPLTLHLPAGNKRDVFVQEPRITSAARLPTAERRGEP